MKKLILFIIILAIGASLASCGAYSDEEAAAIIDGLLIKEADLNGYLYKDSFHTKEDPGEDVNAAYQKYYEVAPDSKYLTQTALKNAIDEIIATPSRQEIYDYAFNGVSGEDFSVPPRFATAENGNLQINVADHTYDGMRTTAILGTAKVKRSNQTHIRAVITVERKKADGTVVLDEKEVEILREDGVWRLLDQTMIIAVRENNNINQEEG